MSTDYDALLGLDYTATTEEWDLEGYDSQLVDEDFIAGFDNPPGIDDGLNDGAMGPLLQTYLEIQAGIEEAMINSETAIKTAQIDAYGTMQAAQADAIARMYEADALVKKGENDNATDLQIAESEIAFKEKELEYKYAELEFKYYEVDNVKTWQAMGMYYKGLADQTEAEGDYAESVADANSAAGSDQSWDSAAGL